MPTLCRPSVAVPEYVITQEETLALARQLHADHPQLPLILRLITNTGVRTRHLIQPIETTLQHPGFEARTRIYTDHAKARLPVVVKGALANAGLDAGDIDVIVYVSCTGFTMPSMTAWLINNLGFRSDTCQVPIAQLGCAAGGTAINRAHDFCLAHPDANALIVSCEFCSLCYQPDDLDVGSLLSNGLFGDAAAAAVVRGDDQAGGLLLEHNGSALVPNTEAWISYSVRSTGFHFVLDRRVPGTMKDLAPVVRGVSENHGWDASDLDFYVIHAGGPRILDDLARFLSVAPRMFRHSRTTLTEHGNIASAVVLDSLRRHFDDGLSYGQRGIVAGFGPGITAEITLGTWTGPAGYLERTHP